MSEDEKHNPLQPQHSDEQNLKNISFLSLIIIPTNDVSASEVGK